MPQNTLRPAHISRNCFKTTRWKGSWPSHQRNSLNLNERGQAGFGIPLRQASVVLNLPHQWGPLAKCFQIYPQWRSPFVFQNFSCCDQFTDVCWPFDFCFVSCPFLKYVFSFFFFFFFPFLFFGEASPGIEANLTVPRNTFVRPWVAPDPLFRPCVLSLSFFFRATRRPFTTRPTQNLSLSPRNSFVSKPSMTLAQLSYVWQQRGFASCAAAVSPFSSSLGFSFLIW